MINFSLEQGSSIHDDAGGRRRGDSLDGDFLSPRVCNAETPAVADAFRLARGGDCAGGAAIFRPMFSYQKELAKRPSLVFLLDRSASMSIADDATGVTRFDQARQQLEKWWDKLKNNFDLHLIAFAENAQLLKDVKDLDGIAPDGKATSLSRALDGRRELAPGGDLEAVILLSDGIHNSARSPLDVAGKLGMTVHTVGVGASLRSNVSYRDIQVTGIDCPDRLFLNNMARITGSIEGIGLAGRVVQVELEEDGQKIAEKELTLQAGDTPQQVSFDFRPTSKGRHTYTVNVPPVAEEKITQNNQRSAMALVVEPGIRVLYIEGTLRAEYGALVDRFSGQGSRPGVLRPGANPAECVLKANEHDRPETRRHSQRRRNDQQVRRVHLRRHRQHVHQTAAAGIVRQARARRGGLVMLGGYHSLGPGGYADTPLGEFCRSRWAAAISARLPSRFCRC